MVELTEFEEIEYEHALQEIGFGKFQIFLLLICGFIYADTALSVTIISFVLPSATCDFQLTSQAKGLLTASPVLGMLFGSYWWGCLADTKGRKRVLIITLLLDGVFGLLSSIAPWYTVFTILRFLGGFSIAGANGICFSYLGEFQENKKREYILCWMELFWSIGLIILPLIAWLIIPLQFRYQFLPGFFFTNWQLFVAVASTPSIILGLLLTYFPESPKFLLEVGEPDAALKILEKIFVRNTGRDVSEYPVESLRETETEYKFLGRHQSIRNLSIRKHQDLKILLKTFWHQTKELCKPPWLKNTVLACSIQFGIFSCYYTMMLWFPEIFQRFGEYEKIHPNASVSVCEVSSVVLEQDVLVSRSCKDSVDENTYVHTLIVGLACVPSSIWLPLCVRKLGAKFFLFFSLVVAGSSIILMNFTFTSLQNLVLSCFFESMASLGESAMYCVMVDLFPTKLRVMASALALTFGRAGALSGSLLFGYLIDLNCIVPIAIFSVLMMASGITGLFLPTTGHESLE